MQSFKSRSLTNEKGISYCNYNWKRKYHAIIKIVDIKNFIAINIHCYIISGIKDKGYN